MSDNEVQYKENKVYTVESKNALNQSLMQLYETMVVTLRFVFLCSNEQIF